MKKHFRTLQNDRAQEMAKAVSSHVQVKGFTVRKVYGTMTRSQNQDS